MLMGKGVDPGTAPPRWGPGVRAPLPVGSIRELGSRKASVRKPLLHLQKARGVCRWDVVRNVWGWASTGAGARAQVGPLRGVPPRPPELQSQASLWELKGGRFPGSGLAPSIPRGDPQACTWASLVSLPPGKSGEAPRCPTRPPTVSLRPSR